MPTPRRKCKLADSKYKDINLLQYSDIIIDTINNTVPGKNPQVFESYFSTDILTQSEAVLIGRALAKIDELSVYGKTVTTFRLFDGKAYSSEEDNVPLQKKASIKLKRPKGGRVQ